MNELKHNIIDSHMHLDFTYQTNPRHLDWMQHHGYVPISWSFPGGSSSGEDIKRYFQRHADLIRQLNDQNYPCYFLVGIHPRSIPPNLKPSEVEDLIVPFLQDPLCLGIGEIGLEDGNAIEQDILLAQLALMDKVKSHGKKFGVHTPRNNKTMITKKTLSILDAFPGIETITVIDHCTPDTLHNVLEKGFHAGITLSPMKISLEDMKIIVEKYSMDLDRIMCNTDSGGKIHEDLYRLKISNDFLPAVRDQLGYETAFRFFIGDLHKTL